MEKKILQSLLFFAFLGISVHTFGQSYLNIANGGKLKIEDQTSILSFNTFISEESQLINRGELTIYGLLVNFEGPSGLVVEADEEGYGSLLHYTNGVQAKVEQYLTSERWHLVSPPVSNSTIEPYLDIYLKEWEEPDASWQYLSSPLSTPMTSTKGYSSWASETMTGSTTVTYAGQLLCSNMAILDLNYTLVSSQAGWNLTGNPYPCALEWNTNWTLNNVGGWAVVYENGTFTGWNPWLPEGERSYNGKEDGFIAPTQGFWVRALDEDPFVLIPQSARAHKPESFLKDEIISSVCNLHLIATAEDHTDETIILFMEDGTLEFDGLFELEKHYNVSEKPNIYSQFLQGKPQSVLVLPDNWIENTSHAIIPVGFELDPNAICTISATGLESFKVEESVYLEDLKEDIMHDMYSGPYEFYSTPDSDPNRFLLHFNFLNLEDEQNQKQILVYSSGEYVYIRLAASKSGTAKVFDILGKEICTFTLQDQLTKRFVPGTGYYIVNVITDDLVISEKVYISN